MVHTVQVLANLLDTLPNRGLLDLRVLKALRLPQSEADRSSLHQGDVLMTEGGDPDKLGRGCVWEGAVDPCLHQNHIFAVRAQRHRLRPHFLSAILSSWYAKAYFQLTAKQTTNLASTNKTTIGSLRLPLPSIEEQGAILERLDEALSSVDKMIAQTQREIDLVREYRTRLIDDVVTGQVDVRDASRDLLAEMEQPDLSAEPDAEESEDLLEGVADDE